MATVIFSKGQDYAFNLDNVDFFKLDEETCKVKFYRKAVSNGKQEWVYIGDWEFETIEEAEKAYRNILMSFGQEIFS